MSAGRRQGAAGLEAAGLGPPRAGPIWSASAVRAGTRLVFAYVRLVSIRHRRSIRSPSSVTWFTRSPAVWGKGQAVWGEGTAWPTAPLTPHPLRSWARCHKLNLEEFISLSLEFML